MGRTLKVLAERELPERPNPASRLLVDLCENVHIHHRDLRMEFSVPEFIEFCAVVDRARSDVETYLSANPEYAEGKYHDLVMVAGGTPHLIKASPKPNRSAYWPHRLRVELIAPHAMGGIHLHWRDFRLNISRKELRMAADAMTEAVTTLGQYEKQAGYRDRAPTPMDRIERQCARKRPVPGKGHFTNLVGGKG